MAHITLNPFPELAPTAAPPDDYQKIGSSPQDFGGAIGAAESRAGSELATAGNALAGAALERQNLRNQIAREDLYNGFLHQRNNLMYGDPDNPADKGFMGLAGEAAMTARPQVQRQLEDLLQQIKKNAPNPRVAVEFEQASRRLQSVTFEEMGRHYEQQSKVYGVSTMDSGLAGEERSVANTYNDDELFQHTRENMRGLAVKKAQLRGEDPLGAQAEADSRAGVARLNGFLAQRDYPGAQRFFEQYSNFLDDKTRTAYANHIHSGMTQAEGDSLANGALGLGPMPRSSAAGATASGDLWSRIKGQEHGLGPAGEALVSPKGAVGVSQIMPATARDTASELGLPFDEGRLHTDHAYNETLGKAYLGKMLGRYGGNEALASAAYNAGPDRVDGWLKTIGDPRRGDITDADFAKAIPIAETRNYVQKIIAGTPREAIGQPAGNYAKFDLAAGDSIGVGLSRHGGIGGVVVDSVTAPEAATADAAGGRNPQQALDFVSTHPERFAGKATIWSSGLMNAGANPGAALPIVGQQLDALKAAGANVVLVGVDQGKFAPYNAQLQAIADSKGVPFAGPLPTKDVHPGPQGYKQYADAAVKLIPPGAAGPANAAAGGAPPQPTDSAPTNRSGLPPLSEVWNKVWNAPGFSDEARGHAWQKAVTRYNAFEADAARSERVQQQQQKEAMQARESEIWADVYSKEPKITASQIATDPAFNIDPMRRRQMIDLINSPPGSSIPKAQSWNAALSLLDRIRRPDGDPQKITDVGQLYEAIPQLNKPDFEFVKKEFETQHSAGGEVFAKRKTELLKQITPFITKSNPLMGHQDAEGDGQLYNFQWMLDQKIQEYRDAKKNPADLLDPSKPDFVGSPKYLEGFQTSMQQSVRSRASAVNQAPRYPFPPPPIPEAPAVPAAPAIAPAPGGNQAGVSVPIPGARPQRNPGETPEQYLQRIGAGLPQPAQPITAPIAR